LAKPQRFDPQLQLSPKWAQAAGPASSHFVRIVDLTRGFGALQPP
jgi:hypothetical protein